MTATPTLLWLTDRSRYETGLDKCLRERYLGYHWGPYGSGIQRKAVSVPLATGLYAHGGIERILRWVLEHDQLPPDTVVRQAIYEAIDQYLGVVTLRGLASFDQGDRVDVIAKEQRYLIEGLTWAFVLTTLPYILEQHRIVNVETEEILVAGCTCGLGVIGEVADHEARGCEGIGFQSRPDFLTEARLRPGVFAYWELKTLGYPGERWETQWPTKIQFAAGALGAARRLEVPISEFYVVGLIKGKREGEDYDPETRRRAGALYQNSSLCYGFYKPAVPPLEPEDWQASYFYRGEDDKNHSLGKKYSKRPVWELPGLADDSAKVEFWAKWMPLETLAKNLLLLGPFPINEVLTLEMVEELVAHETQWKGIVWELHQVWLEVAPRYRGQEHLAWADSVYQAALRRLIPRSWSCRRYGQHHECQFTGICFSEEGWQDPLGSGKFVPRRPHHVAELQQVEARGLVPDAGWADEEEED